MPGVFGAGFESDGPTGLLALLPPHATDTSRTSVAAERRTCRLVMNLILSTAVEQERRRCGTEDRSRGFYARKTAGDRGSVRCFPFLRQRPSALIVSGRT